MTTPEPTSLEEYTARFHANTRVEGYGADVKTITACPFCAAPDFASWRIIATQEDMRRETTCAQCGRSGRMLFAVDEPGHTEGEFVQTAGPSAPAWLIPVPRRVDSATGEPTP